MKRLTIVIAAAIIFAAAWSAAESQAQLNHKYEQNIAQAEPKQKEQPKNTPEQAPEKPQEPPKVEVAQEPVIVAQAPQQAPKAAAPGGCEQYRGLVAQYDWDVRTAMAVMQQESTNVKTGVPCDPNVANWADDHSSWAGCMGSFGLFQINCSHGQLYDPAANVAQAYRMYQASGWSPWTSYTSGDYAKYLR